MQLKKINPSLQKALADAGLQEANTLQSKSYAAIKSGADIIVSAPDGSGKTTAIALHVVQRLASAEGQSPRALIFCEDKAAVQHMADLIRGFALYTDLRIYAVHDKGDIDYDKNQISIGIDVLVGTPTRLNDMFASAGFDVNRLRMFVVDDADALFRNRLDAKIIRISDSISRVQRLFFCAEITEKVTLVADKTMTEPVYFEFDDD